MNGTYLTLKSKIVWNPTVIPAKPVPGLIRYLSQNPHEVIKWIPAKKSRNNRKVLK